MKQFKARVEAPVPGWHAMEIYLEADSILAAGQAILDTLGPLGVSTSHVTKLIEMEEK